jgi:hypothetical protein
VRIPANPDACIVHMSHFTTRLLVLYTVEDHEQCGPPVLLQTHDL